MGRWLGIDHGTKRIGIAVGGTGESFASPLEVIPAEPEDQAILRILELAREYNAEGIVVGWPINMDDTEGPQAKLARQMALNLSEATALDVRLYDERLSSFAADEKLAGTLTRKKRRQRQDALAASHILQDFLGTDGPKNAIRPEQIK